VALHPDDVRHATRVLRLRRGDAITIVSSARLWNAELVDVGARTATARITDEGKREQGELPIDVTIMQALTKGAKFDDVVEKCVELGARRIRPVICARSYAAAGQAKLARWRRIARAAAQQSRRRIIPIVDEPLAWSDALAAEPQPRLLVAYEAAPPRSLAAALAGHAFDKPIAIAVGPEGGFSSDEIALAMKSNAALVSLGPTILRTETAAAALLAAIASRFW
jgi:16S rRNA (uracil1498-N3)-methyltransferase